MGLWYFSLSWSHLLPTPPPLLPQLPLGNSIRTGQAIWTSSFTSTGNWNPDVLGIVRNTSDGKRQLAASLRLGQKTVCQTSQTHGSYNCLSNLSDIWQSGKAAARIHKERPQRALASHTSWLDNRPCTHTEETHRELVQSKIQRRLVNDLNFEGVPLQPLYSSISKEWNSCHFKIFEHNLWLIISGLLCNSDTEMILGSQD